MTPQTIFDCRSIYDWHNDSIKCIDAESDPFQQRGRENDEVREHDYDFIIGISTTTHRPREDGQASGQHVVATIAGLESWRYHIINCCLLLLG